MDDGDCVATIDQRQRRRERSGSISANTGAAQQFGTIIDMHQVTGVALALCADKVPKRTCYLYGSRCDLQQQTLCLAGSMPTSGRRRVHLPTTPCTGSIPCFLQ